VLAFGVTSWLLLAACSSSVEPPPSGAPPGSAGTAAMGGGGGPSFEPEPSCASEPVTRTPLRRLTRFEYANAVTDLLGVDASIARELPADEVTNSFDNNAAVLTVSSLHAEKYVLVSEALAKSAVADVRRLTRCDEQAEGEEACARAFAKGWGRRAFRRAVTPADEAALLAAYSAGRTGGSYAEGIEVMVRAALQSPSFLYRLELSSPTDARARVPLDAYELATRLSFLIWGSGPDDALLDAAGRGELGSKEQLRQKARAMLADPRAQRAISRFFEQWTGAQRLEITTKSTTQFPEFTPGVKAAMIAELPAFVRRVLTEGEGSLRALLTEPVAYVDAALAPLYGVPAPATPGFVTLPPEQGRSGLLTQAGLLSVQGHPDQTSPVLRGKFVRSMLLCDPPPPPPADVDISVPPLSEGATARERMALHLSAGASCSGCHTLMDPIGLAFEGFDALGRYRTQEGGVTLDTSGEILGTSDPKLAGQFANVRELGEKLAQSDQVKACVATQWFRYASGRSEAEADACSLGALATAFASGDVRELIVESTQTDAFLFRSPNTP
jgi:Protein of unknown function (DUF1592)/Protein of unknown function (DUF1588)/Protein of unknown function (DUF1587)/Protein of unknown function (DUF1595)/Protein of unknown function (DUF1585)